MSNLALGTPLASSAFHLRGLRGDRYVVEMLNEKGWIYGGENSGHILALDRHTTGDGIVAALQVLAAMRHSGEGLGSLAVWFSTAETHQCSRESRFPLEGSSGDNNRPG